LTYIKNRIHNVDLVCVNTYDRFGGQIEMKKMNATEYSKDLESIVYKREWAKLKDFHKKTKIKEFIDSLVYPETINKQDATKNRKFLFKTICKGLSDKKFKKRMNIVTYNKAEMKIEDMECIVYNKKALKYQIEWSSHPNPKEESSP
jgi:hypothetical protein